MSPRSFIASESAVSESIGYILILGIMVFSIGMIYMIGYPALQNSIDDSHMQNMERGFTILGNNIDHVVSQDAPKQNVELNLKGGTLKAERASTINIWYIDKSGATLLGWNSVNTPPVGPDLSNNIMTLKYVYHGDKQIGYEFGGVWENIGTNGYVLKEPKIVVGNPFIIPLVDAGTLDSVGGDGVAKVITKQIGSEYDSYNNIEYIKISVTSDYYKGWERYLTSIGMSTSIDGPKTVTGTYDVTKIKNAGGGRIYPDGIEVIEEYKKLNVKIIV